MIVIAGTITAKDEVLQQLLDCLRELKRQTLEHDEGVIAYRFSVDIDNANSIHVYEEWDTTEALKAHMGKPHMDVFRKFREESGFETSGFSRWRAEELGQF